MQCPCSGDRGAGLQRRWHPARSQKQDDGAGSALAEPGRVSFQPQPLLRDSPMTEDINRVEKKIAFLQERREG